MKEFIPFIGVVRIHEGAIGSLEKRRQIVLGTLV
jgi:hypothetical protein